jgi:hypothetical protein
MSKLPQVLLDKTIHRNEAEFLISQLGDEMVLMDIQKGHYININPVGSFIWNQLVSPVTVKDLISSLTEKYDIPLQRCEEETLMFLQKMQEHNMLNIR